MGDATLLFSNDTLLCPDTSALLEVLRMSKDDADLFLDTLESLEQRVVIPPTVVIEVRDLGLKKVEEAVRKETASAKHTGRFLEKKPQGAGAEYHDEYMSALIAVTEDFCKKVRADVERRFQRILALLDGRIGPILPNDVRLQVLGEAPNRYLRRQPPGYADAGKAPRGEAAYGDVLIFFEMIHVARARARDVAFVTADSKEDWWEIDGRVDPRRLLRGRRELSHEFRAESGRAFAVFHALRLASDMNSLDVVFRQVGDVVIPWPKHAALWSRTALHRLYEESGEQIDWLRRFPHAGELASLNLGMNQYSDLIRDLQRGILGEGFNHTTRFAVYNTISPYIAQIVSDARSAARAAFSSNIAGIQGLDHCTTFATIANDANVAIGKSFAADIARNFGSNHLSMIADIVKASHFATGTLIAPDIARDMGLDRLSGMLSVTNRGPWDAWTLPPDSARLLRDMTFNLSSLAPPPYLDQFKAIIERAQNLPSVHPAVMQLDDLSRREMPERRRDASALRRTYSRRRRSLRRRIRGKRINLLDENLPLKRMFIPRPRS